MPALRELSYVCNRLCKIEEDHVEEPCDPDADLVVTVMPQWVNDVPIASFKGNHVACFVMNIDAPIARIPKASVYPEFVRSETRKLINFRVFERKTCPFRLSAERLSNFSISSKSTENATMHKR